MKSYRIKAIVLRHLYEIRHNWFRFSDVFFWPMVDVLLWGFLSVYLIKSNTLLSPFASIFLGAIILWNLYFRIQQDVAYSFLTDVYSRNILNLFTTPMSFKDYLTGTMILGFVKLIFTVIILTLSSYLFYQYNLFTQGWVVFLLLGNLIFSGWVVGIFSVAIILRFGTKADYITWWLPFLIQPFSAVTIPIKLLPKWMQIVAAFIPTSHSFEGLRSLILDGKISYISLISATILNIAFFCVSLLLFSWVFKAVKDKGLLAKLS